jgi:hypothetical protein
MTARKNSRKVSKSTDIVMWTPRGNVQVFYVKTGFGTYPPTRNGNAALGMVKSLMAGNIRAEIVTAYVPDFLVGA